MFVVVTVVTVVMNFTTMSRLFLIEDDDVEDDFEGSRMNFFSVAACHELRRLPSSLARQVPDRRNARGRMRQPDEWKAV